MTHLPRSACAPSRSERVCSRHEAIELSRLCAARPDLSRVMLRMWRAFVFPTLCQEFGFVWAVSYQDAAIHAGNVYRFDGWVQPANIAAASIRAQAGKVAVRWSGAGTTRPASDGGVVRSGWWPVPTSAPSTAMMSVTSRTVHSSAHEGRATSPRGDVAEPNVAEHVMLLGGAGTQGLILMSARRGAGVTGFQRSAASRGSGFPERRECRQWKRLCQSRPI